MSIYIIMNGDEREIPSQCTTHTSDTGKLIVPDILYYSAAAY
jgi:hypothetical protein